jgi:predicted RNase H-like nuclease (RuvC/YqgF family)
MTIQFTDDQPRQSIQRNLDRAQMINHLRDCLTAARDELARIDETLNDVECVLSADNAALLLARAQGARRDINELSRELARLLD